MLVPVSQKKRKKKTSRSATDVPASASRDLENLRQRLVKSKKKKMADAQEDIEGRQLTQENMNRVPSLEIGRPTTHHHSSISSVDELSVDLNWLTND